MEHERDRHAGSLHRGARPMIARRVDDLCPGGADIDLVLVREEPQLNARVGQQLPEQRLDRLGLRAAGSQLVEKPSIRRSAS